MQCATCGTDNLPQARFCARCGTPLVELAAAASAPATPTPPAPPQPPTQADQTAPSAPVVKYGGLAIRLGALFIDLLVVVAIGIAVAFWTDAVGIQGNDSALALVVRLLNLAWPWLYFWLFTGIRGQTPGKMVTGIIVVDERGNVPGLGRAALRELLGKTISTLALFIGFLWIAWDPGKQGWHDKLASTYVVRRSR